MNKHIKIFSLALSFVALSACGDEKEFFPDVLPAEGARIKIMHAAVDNLTGQTATSIRSFNTLVDDAKVNGQAVAYGAAYPASDYMTLAAGSRSFKFIAPLIAASGALPEIPESLLLDTQIDPASEQYYSVALLSSGSSFETLVINDDLSSVPNDGSPYIRLVNLMDNTTNGIYLEGTPPKLLESDPAPVPVQLTPIIAYKANTTFIPLTIPGVYTNVRIKDGVSNAVLATLTAGASSTFQPYQVATIFARGRAGLPAADAKRAQLARTNNR